MKKRLHYNVYDVIRILILVMFTLLSLYPFIYTLAGSFSQGLDYEHGGIFLFPRKFTLANYKVVFSDYRLYISLRNNILITGIGTILSLIVTSMVAYAMSSNKLKGKKFFWYFNLATMFFSGGMIPFYMVMLLLGLYDNFLIYFIPSVYSVFNMIILHNFFKSVDVTLKESAWLDGASEFRIYWSIYLPISKPAIATIAMWLILGKWNSYTTTLLYTDKSEQMWTLQYYLMRIIKDFDTPPTDPTLVDMVSAKTINFAAIVVSILPIIAIYPLFSKYFSKGIMVGSLKG